MITPEAVDKLENELGGIFTVAKTHHYDQGQKYGHLASAIPEAKYRLLIVNPAWTHTVPTNPGAYSVDALTAGNAAATREQYVAQHKVKQKSYNNYLSVNCTQSAKMPYPPSRGNTSVSATQQSSR